MKRLTTSQKLLTVAGTVVVVLGLVVLLRPEADEAAPRAATVDRTDAPHVENLSHHDPPSAGTRHQLPCTSADEPTNFPTFSLGPSFEAHRVRYTVRQCKGGATEHRVRANDVVSVYGTCKSAGEGRCSPPLSVESWPACQRSLADYETWQGEPYPHSAPVTWDRGAISVSFDRGTRVEVYTGRSTIVFFGTNPELVARALGFLRSEPRRDRVQTPAATTDGPIGIDTLPGPVAGTLDGTLACSTGEERSTRGD